ncbi:hypothetical protein M422DRAFT_272874 [Sphaerobolus stellatus SS14]|uniref:RlpA-like protein double-psi beta-barrel domain-containing protein n=1 Tax=Sphaerobolus stellatus (strain SS14) TaxID=990650 RepID=A0A0C9UKT9_SPHS4|nr:hypothetical protein M422DRAFT_272874 [Sphaerobolus stellatus SS14]
MFIPTSVKKFSCVLLSVVYILLESVHSSPVASGEDRTLRRTNSVQKRERATWFVTGIGACGNFNVNSDFIIALSIPQYANGANCGKGVTITYNGVTAHATVADECPGCPEGAIDLTEGLFTFLAGSLSVGVIDVEWSFDE